MLDDFLVRAALGSVGVALAAAPLGGFVVWRRMAFFGDATAHAAILGVALSLALSLPIMLGTLAVALITSLAVVQLTRTTRSNDMVLGVLSHGSLALGLVATSLVVDARLDLESYLFGDILAVGRQDLALIWGGALAVWALLVWRWQRLLTATVSPDLAYAAGINPDRESRILMLALALVVAVAIKVVGALLIGALLVIPAAAARAFARTPEQMVALASVMGSGAALGGLWGAYHFDTPAGPSIVCAAGAIFLLSLLRRS
jgi:zinc transport system permease protein